MISKEAYAYKAEAWSIRSPWCNNVFDIIRNLPENGVLVDLGCNMGKFLEVVSQEKSSLKLYGIDVNEYALEEAKKRVSKAQFFTGIEQVPESIDVVVCIHSMLQMEDPSTVFSNVWKKLKPKGKLFIITHNRLNRLLWKIPNMFNGYKDDETIHNRHTLNEFRKFFRSHGFLCEELRYYNQDKFTKILPIFSQHMWYVGRKP